MSKVWLITGASRGLGRSILEAALQDGGKVLATARDTARFADWQARREAMQRWKPVTVAADFDAASPERPSE